VEHQLLTGRADLHMHTTASDGMATPQRLLDYIARRGHLDVIAITDHDVIDGSLWAYSQQGRYPFDIIPGVEITCHQNQHMLALWVTQLIPGGMSLEETAAAIHEQGGIAILAHPFEIMIAFRAFWRHLLHPEVLLRTGIDAIEIFNAGTLTPGNNILARRMCKKLGLPALANSDAHLPRSTGRGITYFPGRTAAELRHALVTGQTYAEGTSWPITDYLRLSPSSILRMWHDFMGTNTPSVRPTPP
jgi:predicted metal-dependent phosphoesterase TrpH